MKWVIYIVSVVAGASLPSTSFDAGVASLLVTFFGLMAAAILTASSLLVGNVLSSAWTVSRLITLKAELDTLIESLLRTLIAVVLGSLCVIVYDAEIMTSVLNLLLDTFTSQSLKEAMEPLNIESRLTLGGIILCLVYAVNKIPFISRAFKKVMQAKYELALADSRRRTERAAPTADSIRTSFATPQDFGSKVSRDKR